MEMEMKCSKCNKEISPKLALAFVLLARLALPCVASLTERESI